MAGDNYAKAIAAVFLEEGGYANHPSDPGGATNMGITQATLAGFRGRAVSVSEVKSLSKTEAEAIYRKQYANTIKFDDLPAGVDLMVLDFAVNSGPATAAKALQRAVGANPDGVVGVRTLAAAAKRDPAVLVDDIHKARLEFLQKLKTWPTFGKGWQRRVDRIRDIAISMALHQDAAIPARLSELPEPGKGDPVDVRLTATSTGQASLVAGAAGLIGVAIEVLQMAAPQIEHIAGAEAAKYVAIVVALGAITRNVILERARIARGQAGV